MKANRPKYVKGSFQNHLHIGQGGGYKGIKVGAEFRTPSGRGILVKGIAGYHGKPHRKLDVTPGYSKATKTVTVAAKANGARIKANPAKVRRQSAGSKVSVGTAARKSRATPSRSASAGRKVRR